MADGDDAYVKIPHAKTGQKGFTGAVPDLGIGQKGQRPVHPFLVPIHRQYHMPQCVQLLGNVPAEPTQSHQ